MKHRHLVTTQAKTAIMAGALVATGIVELLEGIEDGMNPVEAALKAYEKTKERGLAIQEAVKKRKT